MNSIEKAAAGLLFTSESDHPLTYFELNEPASDVKTALLQLCNTEGSSVVEVQTPEYFFRNHIRVPDSEDEQQKLRAVQFTQLLATLHETLTDIQVYRIGTIRVEAFVVGKTKQNTFAGVRTLLIET